MVAWTEYRDIARDRGALALEIYVVTSTPAKGPEAIKESLPDHLAYQREMEDSGKLVMAGPMSDATGEHMLGVGLIVYRANSLEEATALAEADPMHATGARSFEIRKWLVNEGNMTINVGLSTGHVKLS